MISYNLNKLIKITVVPHKYATWQEWRPERKILGFVIDPEGVYCSVTGNFLGNKIYKDQFLKDGVLYDKPRVVFTFDSNVEREVFVDSVEDAQKLRDEIVKLSSLPFYHT